MTTKNCMNVDTDIETIFASFDGQVADIGYLVSWIAWFIMREYFNSPIIWPVKEMGLKLLIDFYGRENVNPLR